MRQQFSPSCGVAGLEEEQDRVELKDGRYSAHGGSSVGLIGAGRGRTITRTGGGIERREGAVVAVRPSRQAAVALVR